MTVCLNMIVKNEAGIIRRCLDSVRGHIDSWAIVDTGSTDGTQALVRDALRGIPGELVEREWTDFATARNQARELARGRSDYLLFIDADEELTAPSGWTMPTLEADHYAAAFLLDGREWFARNLLARTDVEWRWDRVIHERIWPVPQCTTVAGVTILSHRDGARAKDPTRHAREAAMLERALAIDPTDTHSAFHATRSHWLAGAWDAVRVAGLKRIALAGDPAELWEVHSMLAAVAEIQRRPHAEIVAHHLAGMRVRGEPCVQTLYRHASYLRRAGRMREADAAIAKAFDAPAGMLFASVDRTVLHLHVPREFATSCYRNGRGAAARTAVARMIDDAQLPPALRASLTKNPREQIALLQRIAERDEREQFAAWRGEIGEARCG